MKQRTSSRLAWSIGLVSVAMIAASLVLMYVDRHAVLPTAASSEHWTLGNVLSDLVNMAVPVLGIVIASKRPENRIGWLFLSAGFFLGVSTIASQYAVHALVVHHGSLPGGNFCAWLNGWINLIPLGLLAFLFLLFPTGHLKSRRWLPAGWFVGLSVVLLSVLTGWGATTSWSDPYSASANSGGGALAFFVFVLPFFGLLLVALFAVVMRFRGAVGDERLQLKWFAAGAVLIVISFFASFLLSPSATSSPPAYVSIFQSLSFILLWSAIGIAVLKYRLYEIDVVINRAVVYGTLAVFITVIYVGLVAGIGTLIGHKGSPLLSAIAAAVIAVAFQPVRERTRRFANRVVYGKRATPYEVLGEFSSRVGETLATEDVLPRMAQTLAEGTGAARADIWLKVGEELRDEAPWPPDSERQAPVRPVGEDVSAIDGDLATPVLYQGELLGAISITKRARDPLTPTESKLATDLAAQAGLMMRNAQLTGELLTSLGELRASRQRIVTAQDQARRRLERNIHDGAQQQLVALAVKQRLAAGMVIKDPEKTVALLGQLQAETADALETLRDLARGIYPPLLADEGLAAALQAQSRKSALPTTVESDGIDRYPQEAEAAVYFCALEALQNAAKYAQASRATVRLSAPDGVLAFAVEDDGVGFDIRVTRFGTGMQGMSDRLAALGGELRVTSTPGTGTRVEGEVPVGHGATTERA
jgi:signal transduction histidine kinase